MSQPAPLPILAIDTALSSLQLALVSQDLRLEYSQDMQKGQAEALFPAIEALLGKAGLTIRDVRAIAVNIGPGSFTGTRVGVAAAKGLAFAHKLPIFGVTTLQGVGYALSGQERLVVMDARRDQFYAQGFGADEAETLPAGLYSLGALKPHFQSGRKVIGSAAELLKEDVAAKDLVSMAYCPPLNLADLALKGVGAGTSDPLYLRDADAKPQGHKVLPRAGASA